MKLLFLTFLFLIVNLAYGFSQVSYYDFGARSKGLGNSNSTLSDEWSIFNNVGGISGNEYGSVFFTYDQYLEIEGFNQVAAGAIQPLSIGSVGISVSRFGDDLFSEQTISAAFGNKIGFVRLGVKASYYQMRIDEFGSASTVYFDFGGIVELSPKITFGAFISNFTLSKLNNSAQSKLPVIMKLGMTYRPIKKLMMNLDIYKDVSYQPIVKAGIEYVLVDKFYLRTGINTNPLKSFFGLGLFLDRFKIDYAISNHDFLGLSHQASISYKFIKRDKE